MKSVVSLERANSNKGQYRMTPFEPETKMHSIQTVTAYQILVLELLSESGQTHMNTKSFSECLSRVYSVLKYLSGWI